MVGWESIPIIYKVYSYIENYIDLNRKEKNLVVKEEQLKKLEQELNYLNKINEENSINYKSMVDFILFNNNNNIYIQAGDNEPSPHLEFDYYISNRSLFNLRINKIRMKLFLNNYGELGEINTSDILDLSHQQIIHEQIKFQLHSNTIQILKSLKKEGRENLIKIHFSEIKIGFEGDKVFSKPWPHGFSLEIPMSKVNVTI